MRIISKTHDYYDIGLSYGIDPTVIYLREPAEVRLNLEEFFEYEAKYGVRSVGGWTSHSRKGEYQKTYQFSVGVLLFCGKVYPYVRLKNFRYGEDDTYFYSYEEYVNFAESNEFITSKQARKYEAMGWWQVSKYGHAKKWFELCHEKITKDIALEIHRKTNSPIVKITRVDYASKEDASNIVKDPILKEMGFAHVVDPWTAFQELSMFIPAYLNTTVKETVDISNEDRVAKHGFNDKSFRHPVNSRKKKK